MKIQYFILAKTLFTRNHQLLLTPELQETYREGIDDELINRICHKVNYYSFEDEMTLKDISLIEDLKNEECYLFFIATDKPAQALEHVNLPWGEGLPEALTEPSPRLDTPGFHPARINAANLSPAPLSPSMTRARP